MDVKRHGFESSSRDPNPVSISIVSQFVSIQANISLDSDHKGTQVSLWRGGRTLFLCPGTAAPCKFVAPRVSLAFGVDSWRVCVLQWGPATAFL
jgi:hypothetical protein